MASCLRALGASIDESLSVVRGVDALAPGPLQLDAGLSGTTARFLLPVLGAGPGPYTLDGAPPLQARPMADLVAAVRSLGATVSSDSLPLTVSGPGRGGTVHVPGDVTSQFVSALMLAGPLYPDGVTVELTTDAVSRPYIEMTQAVMDAFGASSGYRPASFAIEPDASAASYFFALAALEGRTVTVPGLHRGSLQGDVGFVDVLRAMGASVEDRPEGLTVTGGGSLLGGEFDLRDMPDMAQTLAVVAACAVGPTRVTGVGFIRGHETDRIAAVVRELQRCGVDSEEERDGFVVRPTGHLHGARIETYDDHRMAMSFALLPGVEIDDPDVVNKTFPGYWVALDELRSAPR